LTRLRPQITGVFLFMKRYNVIYKISALHSEKIYIGSSVYYNSRYNQHKYHLLKGSHSNGKLQNYVNKYGFNTLKFEIIDTCKNKKHLIHLEQFYIDNNKNLFNIRLIAHSMLGTKRTKEQIEYMISQRKKNGGYRSGFKLSEETKKKIGDAHRGKTISEKQRRGHSLKMKGKKFNLSDEQREAKRKVWLGKNHSDESKKIMSENQIGEKNNMYGKFGDKHHFFGKKHSKSTIDKLRKTGSKIINTETGKIYECLNDVLEDTKIPKGTMGKYLAGLVISKQNWKYYETKD